MHMPLPVASPPNEQEGVGADLNEDEFDLLVRHLKEALESKGGKGKVWLPEKERKSFKIMLVDKVRH